MPLTTTRGSQVAGARQIQIVLAEKGVWSVGECRGHRGERTGCAIESSLMLGFDFKIGA